MATIPKIPRRVNNTVQYSFRRCPYSNIDVTNRIPLVERTPHVITSGQMSIDTRGGHDNVGFICLDPTCPFFRGTATTQVVMRVRDQKLNKDTGEYHIEYVDIPIPICSGTHFWEK